MGFGAAFFLGTFFSVASLVFGLARDFPSVAAAFSCPDGETEDCAIVDVSRAEASKRHGEVVKVRFNTLGDLIAMFNRVLEVTRAALETARLAKRENIRNPKSNSRQVNLEI